MNRSFALLLLLPLLTAGCEGRSGWRNVVDRFGDAVGLTSARAPEDDAAFERRRWLDKTARTLRGGRGLDDAAFESELLSKSDEEIIEALLARPEFADTVLDFNMHFLGFRRDVIREADGSLAGTVFDFPSALSSAREVLRDGDYLKLLDLEQPLFLPPLGRPTPFDGTPADEPVETTRARRFAFLNASLDRQIADLRARPGTTLAQACSAYMDHVRQGYVLMDVGLSASFMDIVYGTNLWYGRLVEACIGPFRPEESLTTETFIAELEAIRAVNDRLFPRLADFEPAVYPARDLAALRALDPRAVGLAPSWHLFGNPHRQSLQNSSTNFNRKRAAYVLSRFFCDDLTPINVEPGQDHAGGAHGTEPACMACHYKLDPMAGFFRDYGMNFGDYFGKPRIRFDDNAGAELAEYQRAWRAPAGAKRAWNVGFIRSSSKESLNLYGSSLADLFRIIRNEPEVKSCLVKRMFEYYVSEQQALDAGYHEHLTKEFTRLAKINSTRAFKDITKKILLGRSFREPDPVSDRCYDYPPGFDPEGTPPCQVAHLLEKNCATCHSGTDEEPFLDLTSWRRQPDGTWSFPHYDGEEKRIPRQVTFQKILERLSTTDPKRRMPLRKHMSPLDRETLFKWVNGVLSGTAAAATPARDLRAFATEVSCPAR